MIKDNIEFFNVEEIKEDGTLLRFKEDLILGLGCQAHKRGRFYGYRSIGCELRFKTITKFFDITFEAVKEDTNIYLFYGDYMDKKYVIPANQKITLHIEIPDKIFNNISKLPKLSFAPNVIRFVIGYSGYIKYHGINTFGASVELPTASDEPTKSLLIYGSSISHGSEALEYVDSYAFLLSKFLNVNVINKSIPGSCQAEYSMVDYLSTIKCDATFVEFGVNVLNLYDIEEYKKHLDYIVTKLNNNLYLTSVLDNHNLLNEKSTEYENMMKYRDYASKISNVKYIDPSCLISGLSSLTTDLLHPSNFGQLEIVLYLKERIKI